MKKLALFSTLSLLAIGANAQFAKYTGSNAATREVYHASPAQTAARPSLSAAARTTAAPFFTETFGSGTNTTLPTGWTATGNNAFPATWKWHKAPCTGPYSLSAINSTTASNGWMVYDSDSIGGLSPAVPIEGWLTSPSISCTGHNTVELSFQEWFRKFRDSCFVEVSNNNGTTWTQFPVAANNNMPDNTDLPANAYKARLNISAVAANMPNVKIRFYYRGRYSGGSFNWLVDDVALAELDSIEAGIDNSGILCYGGPSIGFISFASIPLQIVDTLYPVTFLSNFGANPLPAVPVTTRIYKGTAQVFTQTVPYTNLPVSAADSLVDFTVAQGYYPSSSGNYTTAYSINPAGDALPANNADSARFTISDSVWSQSQGIISGSYYIHRKAASGVPESSFSIGTVFRVPASKKDTLTGASVCFNAQTTPGAKVSVQIYSFDPGSASWGPVASTIVKPLNASDISTSTAAVYSYFPADLTSGVNSLILNGGANGTSYAAVVTGTNIPASSTVLVNATQALVPSITGTAGAEDTSANDGSFSFASNQLPAALSGVAPMVRLHFGNTVGLGVKETFANEANVNAFPNPASDDLTVSFTLQQAADVTVKIMNTLGQTVATQQISKVGKGETRTAVFSTSSLAQGVYFYTVAANGAQVTKRFVVVH